MFIVQYKWTTIRHYKCCYEEVYILIHKKCNYIVFVETILQINVWIFPQIHAVEGDGLLFWPYNITVLFLILTDGFCHIGLGFFSQPTFKIPSHNIVICLPKKPQLCIYGQNKALP